MIQKMFVVVLSFVIGLLGSFVLNVELLAITGLPDRLKSSKEYVYSIPPIHLAVQ